jgi:asparagine synthase (glutamine-hydrolysing)
MCGIAGIVMKNRREELSVPLKQMTDAISHRGPDGEGFFCPEGKGVALGHRRLSIIDLSHEADQPMHSADGRYTIVFNGEIYNYIEIREELKAGGHSFSTSSDTEVLLAAYMHKGAACLQDLDGMFAFVIYDALEESLFFARDRFGEKPFYYAYKPGEYFLFASEIKALRTQAGHDAINDRQLYNYLAFGFVYTPDGPHETFYAGIRKLPAAHYGRLSAELVLEEQQYWNISLDVDPGIRFDQAQEKFRELMSQSVQRRLRSDVPIGSSLSGGLDSSIIVCLIDSLNSGKSMRQNTFSAKFPGFAKDESYFIDMAIGRTNVKPHFVYPDEQGFLDAFEKLCYHQDEPFGSASIFAQWEVMRLAKESGVTVLLDGQGADEILAGYHQYYTTFFQELFLTNRTAYRTEWGKYVKLQPAPIKRDYKFYGGIYLNRQKQYFGWLKDRLDNRFKDYFASDFYSENRRHSVALQIKTKPSLNHELYKSVTDGRLETLLRLADRNSMAHSREVRLPFLSHHLVEFLFTLPATFKISEGWTKMIARKAFEPILPPEITWRKDKIGYEPPQKKWMQHRQIVELVQESRATLVRERILNKKVLDEPVVAAAASERGNNSWSYLMAAKLFA